MQKLSMYVCVCVCLALQRAWGYSISLGPVMRLVHPINSPFGTAFIH